MKRLNLIKFIGAATILAGVFSVHSGAYASMAIGAGASVSDQTVADGTFDYSVYVNMEKHVGSGGLFDIELKTDRFNQDYFQLCFVTADHVVAGDKFAGIRFNGPGGTNFSVGGAGQFSSISRLGSTGKEDIAYIGVKVPTNTITAAQKTYLSGFSSKFADITPGAYSVDDIFDSYGYGPSAKSYTTISGSEGFFTDFSDATATPGTHRNVNLKMTSSGNYTSGIYSYDAVKWNVEKVQTRGQINSGDSGGIILNDGNWVGINTYAEGIDVVNGAGTTIGEFFKKGSEGGGLAFTGDNKKWLGDNCDSFGRIADTVPEPATFIALGAGIAAFARRRKSAK